MMVHILSILSGMIVCLGLPMALACAFRIWDRWHNRAELRERWILLMGIGCGALFATMYGAYVWWLAQYYPSAVTGWGYVYGAAYRCVAVAFELLTIHALTMGHPKCRHCWRWCAAVALAIAVVLDVTF